MSARLTDTQCWALGRLDDQQWRGTRESSVSPNTGMALFERGLVERRDLGRRLEWRLTNAGVAARARCRHEVTA